MMSGSFSPEADADESQLSARSGQSGRARNDPTLGCVYETRIDVQPLVYKSISFCRQLAGIRAFPSRNVGRR